MQVFCVMDEDIRREIAELKAQITALEARLDGAPADTAPGWSQRMFDGGHPEIVELLRSGRKIEAIKLHRERTGLGLREAKEAVEALERQLGL